MKSIALSDHTSFHVVAQRMSTVLKPHHSACTSMAHRLVALTLLVLVALAWTASAQASICYVNHAASGANNGASWGDASTDLQSALTNPDCTEIWVAEGVYKPVVPANPANVTKAERDVSFTIFPDVAVYGGFAGYETRRDDRVPPAHPTILSGDIDNNDINADGNFISETVDDLRGTNSYHVVRIGNPSGGAVLADTVLDGFIVTGGLANGWNDGVALLRWLGGGLLCTDLATESECSPTLAQLVFSGNFATSGGGLFAGIGNPSLEYVEFSGNKASLGGGAYFTQVNAVMTDVHFTGNSASSGGAVYVTDASLAVSKGVFSDNLCGDYSSGGAIFADAGTLPGYSGNDTRRITLTETSFINNRCGEGSTGGGIRSEVQESATIVLELDGVTFRGNDGAIFNRGANGGHLVATIINSTFQGNNSYIPAVFNQAWDGTTTTTLNHVTFEGNSGAVRNDVASGTGGAVVNLGNVIIWNEPQTVSTDVSGGAISNIADSIITGGCPAGSSCSNVIDSNPLLGSLQDNGGATLTMLPLANSPAIGAGSLATCANTDQRGVPRPQGTSCDIGAVEIAQPTSLIVTVSGSGSISATPDLPPLKLSGGIVGCTALWGSNCQAVYAQHVEVTLTATAGTNAHLDVWEGDCIADPDAPHVAHVTLESNSICTARFTSGEFQVSAVAHAGGTISPALQWINDGGAALVTVTPDAGYLVDTVTGDTCTPADNGDDTWTAPNISADCQVTASFAAPSYHVGGTVIGLAGSGLVVQNNAGDDLAIAADGAFQFPGTLIHGDGYAVSVLTQPDQPLQDCTVFQGTGSMGAADVSDVHIVCNNRYHVGGSVNGLTGGQGVTLQLNGGSDLVNLANGQFSFPANLSEGATYLVTVSGQPQGHACSVARASGTIAGADIVDIEVACEALVAQLAVTLDDGDRDYARYGRVLTYVVTLANHGTGSADNVAINATFSAGIDIARVSWQCITPPGSGTACGAQGSGGFSDNALVAAGRSLTWLLDVPILADSDEPTAAVTIETAGANTEIDTNTLVLLRDGFDVPYSDGTQRIDGFAATAVLQGDTVATVEVPQAEADGIRALLYLRSVDRVVEVHWLKRGPASWVRLQVRDARGVEQTTPWAAAPLGSPLSLGSLRGEDEGTRLLLLEGAPAPLVLLLDIAAPTD